MPTTPYCPLLFLWELRSVFIGSLIEPIDVSTGASTLMVGLDKPIRFLTDEMTRPIQCRSLLIPAGTCVVVDTQGAFFFNCTLDPMGADLLALSKLMTKSEGNTFYQLQDEQNHINTLLSICAPPLDTKNIQATLNNFINLGNEITDNNSIRNFDLFPSPEYIADNRIARVIAQIQGSISENTSLTQLASMVSLSPAYLSERFKTCTGLPIRRYRLWHRLYSTVKGIGQGKNITEVAMESGFNDSSHFIRTFRSMLGMTPTSIFMQAIPLELMVAEANENDKNQQELIL